MAKKDPLKDKRNPDGTIKKGESGNLNGRPRGAKGYLAQWKKVVKKIADIEKKDKNDIELDLIISGYKNALKGNYRFYQDILDRVYGKAVSHIEIKDEREDEVKDTSELLEIAQSYEEKIKETIQKKLPDGQQKDKTSN